MVRAHDPIDDGEAEACALGVAARLVQPCERLAHALDLALWDARSAVGDLDARLPPALETVTSSGASVPA